MNYLIIFYCLISLIFCHEEPVAFLKAFNTQAYQWIGISDKTFQSALDFCKFEEFEDDLMQFIHKIQHVNQNFTLQTLDAIDKALRSNKNLKSNIKCLASFSHTKIPFIEQRRKISTIRQYINKYPEYSQKVFHQQYAPEHKGKQLGKWMKGFIQSETLSTVLLRSLSTKVEVLKNRDFSFCIDLQDAGKISQQLQNLDINSIFLKIPAVFNTLKYLHLKLKCQTPQNIQIIKNLQKKIKDIDMFKIMYYQYEPYVTISTQKYGISKIKLLATCFSKIINNAEEVRREQIIKLEEEQKLKKQTKKDTKSDGQL